MKYSILLFTLLVLGTASCKYTQKQEKQAEHEHASIQITAYNNDFELFAEADSFVKGSSSNILSHFSNLPDFTALEDGRVTIRLVVNGIEINQTLVKPTRKGIYSFDLIPNTKGIGELVFDIETENGNSTIVVPNITVYLNEHEAHEAAEEEVVSKTNTTVFTKEQSWKIDFATAFPIKEPIGEVIKATAQIQSAPGDEEMISAGTNGIITFSKDKVMVGSKVTRGQVVFSISGSGLVDNNSIVRFKEAENNFEKTKSDYDRLKELVEDKIVSEKKLLEAKNEYDNAKLIYDNLLANFSLSGQNVISTMDGFVKQVFVQNGQYVETGEPILVVTQNRKLLLTADVQQKYASKLDAIKFANIRAHNNEVLTLEQLNGKILSYGKSTNDDNFLIPVNLEIDNNGNFVPGSFVELFLKTVTNKQATTIPNSALIEELGNYFVYIQITPELFEKREVKVGVSDGIKSEIVKGITKNDRIVTQGAILIKLAQSIGALDAHSGHVH